MATSVEKEGKARFKVIGGKDGLVDQVVQAIEARLSRSAQQAKREFKPDFSSAEPLLKLGLTPRAAEALLWLAQGKTNSDIATILGITESTVKKHVQEMFEKLGVQAAPMTASATSKFIDDERIRWGDIVKSANLIYAGSKSSVCFSDKFLTTVGKETNIAADQLFLS